MPHPHWIRTEDIAIPAESINKAAELLTAELGDAGIEAIGGRKWWLWRRKDAELKAEWIEMRSDYNNRQRQNKKCRRVMLYIHGGGYFFGSVDEHRYQLQRHARKLQARVFAPRYRLAPQFPFPCALLDCLAAYIYLLTIHEPNEIVFAGDSAGGGMVLSLLCLLRDRGCPLPAGGILISPWVDLTHSFPSLSRRDGFDYIPPHGFHQKPSKSWPPPNEDELQELARAKLSNDVKDPSAISGAASSLVDPSTNAHTTQQRQPPIAVQIDGRNVVVKDQVQLYTTNELITHPLVSPALQPSLGGLPPLCVMVGGGELLRDEQIYIAHKAANPHEYQLPEQFRGRYDPNNTLIAKYKPTPVQLQVWEDLCHVTPTLSFTRPAKYMYRSVAQFGAWALSRAQNRAIDIEEAESSDDDSSSEDDDPKAQKLSNGIPSTMPVTVGKAGDPLPPFTNHMIRQRVDRNGMVYPLEPTPELEAFEMDQQLVGAVKVGPIRTWLATKAQFDSKYASTRHKIMKERIKDVKTGRAHCFEGENPPPSALAARLHEAETYSRTQKIKKSWGLGMWSSWGMKHDERTVHSDEKLSHDEKKQDLEASAETPTIAVDGTHEIPSQEKSRSRSRARSTGSRRRTISVRDEGQVEGESTRPMIPKAVNADTDRAVSGNTVPKMIINSSANETSTSPDHLSPMFMPKFKTSLFKDEGDSASMMTQTSVLPDNASTRAVFSASGVTSATEQSTMKSTPVQDGIRPVTPAPKDNLGGYDTPHSRRSVERLQRHDTELSDEQSLNTASIINGDGRMQALRSPSTMAVVQAEGVIEPVNDRDTAQLTNGDFETGHKDPMSVNGNVSGDGATTNGIKNGISIGDKATTTENRPALYGRDDSTFVTAMEKL